MAFCVGWPIKKRRALFAPHSRRALFVAHRYFNVSLLAAICINFILPKKYKLPKDQLNIGLLYWFWYILLLPCRQVYSCVLIVYTVYILICTDSKYWILNTRILKKGTVFPCTCTEYNRIYWYVLIAPCAIVGLRTVTSIVSQSISEPLTH